MSIDKQLHLDFSPMKRKIIFSTLTNVLRHSVQFMPEAFGPADSSNTVDSYELGFTAFGRVLHHVAAVWSASANHTRSPCDA